MSPGTGSVQSALTLAPGGNGPVQVNLAGPGKPIKVTEIIVTIAKVTAHSNTAGWVTLASTETTIDILKLAQYAQVLGLTHLPAGKVTQIRLYVKEGGTQYVTRDDGVKVDLKVPSGIESGIKLHGLFDVQACANTVVNIQWDGKKSIWVHPTGQGDLWILRPVIRLGQVAATGVACTPSSPNPPVGGAGGGPAAPLPPVTPINEGGAGGGTGNPGNDLPLPPIAGLPGGGYNEGSPLPPLPGIPGGGIDGVPGVPLPGGPYPGLPGGGTLDEGNVPGAPMLPTQPAAPGGLGVSCSTGPDCLSGRCSGGLCQVGGPDAPCKIGADCASGVCTVEATCGLGNAGGAGSVCSSSTQCLSSSCVSGQCDVGGQGAPCGNGADCAMGFACTTGFCEAGLN